MYRNIGTNIWTDPKFRNLNEDEKLLFFYFLTNLHSHLSGIYYIPISLIIHETGLPEKVVRKSLDTLSKGYRWGIDTLSIPHLAVYDTASEVIWVKNMLRYQGHGKKIMAHVAKHIKELHKCPLLKDFLLYYKELGIPYRYGIDGVSVQDQDQDQDQLQDLFKNGESVRFRPDSEDIFTALPCLGNSKNFAVTRGFLKDMQELFPDIDIKSVTMRAKAWLINNPKRRKAPGNVPRFLNGFYNDAAKKIESKKEPEHKSDPGKNNETNENKFSCDFCRDTGKIIFVYKIEKEQKIYIGHFSGRTDSIEYYSNLDNYFIDEKDCDCIRDPEE